MARRSDQRRRAVFALYQHDLTGRPLEQTLPREAAVFTRALAQAVLERQPELDVLIASHAEGWALDRIAPLERSLLRVALLEMLHPDAVPGQQPIPPEGAIDEAVETAKAYCGADAPGFVNGILAAVLRERQAAETGAGGTSGSAPRKASA
ncbi:MAG TPA: transcription antitermination protein NusB [Conexibacter sp.]|nr:transcription antitermination protein NusB [Conexibacter sp.]